VTVSAGGGNDLLRVSPTAHLLANLAGALTVNGDAGADSLFVNDQSDTGANTYTLTATTVARTASAVITYATVETLAVNTAGAAGTSVEGQGPVAATGVTVNAGGAGDVITVGGPANPLDGLLGPLTVAGNGGTDVLRVRDQGSSVGRSYPLTATALT